MASSGAAACAGRKKGRCEEQKEQIHTQVRSDTQLLGVRVHSFSSSRNSAVEESTELIREGSLPAAVAATLRVAVVAPALAPVLGVPRPTAVGPIAPRALHRRVNPDGVRPAIHPGVIVTDGHLDISLPPGATATATAAFPSLAAARRRSVLRCTARLLLRRLALLAIAGALAPTLVVPPFALASLVWAHANHAERVPATATATAIPAVIVVVVTGVHFGNDGAGQLPDRGEATCLAIHTRHQGPLLLLLLLLPLLRVTAVVVDAGVDSGALGAYLLTTRQTRRLGVRWLRTPRDWRRHPHRSGVQEKPNIPAVGDAVALASVAAGVVQAGAVDAEGGAGGAGLLAATDCGGGAAVCRRRVVVAVARGGGAAGPRNGWRRHHLLQLRHGQSILLLMLLGIDPATATVLLAHGNTACRRCWHHSHPRVRRCHATVVPADGRVSAVRIQLRQRTAAAAAALHCHSRRHRTGADSATTISVAGHRIRVPLLVGGRGCVGAGCWPPATAATTSIGAVRAHVSIDHGRCVWVHAVVHGVRCRAVGRSRCCHGKHRHRVSVWVSVGGGGKKGCTRGVGDN